ncbi:ligand-binding protein, receptor family [Oesophagostomum dentatum]|uniref:guanylate cyclase n=1 Tax=Oesophagostomum dentatum TaxID=61180 RepID=A0A0B1T7J3_OESDE|nr:ligand-binding protein, receptor family [Oesophagostomum dentatum]
MLMISDMMDAEVTIGYKTTASAVLIARDRIIEEQLLPGIDFNFTLLLDQCSEDTAAVFTVRLYRDYNVDAVLGPTCSYPAVASAIVGSYYNIPVLAWGRCSTSTLEDRSRFPTAAVFSTTSFSLGVGVSAVALYFKWHEFAFLYTADGGTSKCDVMKSELQDAVTKTKGLTISTVVEIKNMTSSNIIRSLQEISTRARIIVVCIADGFGLKRQFILAAKDGGYLSSEYVYIFPDIKSRGFCRFLLPLEITHAVLPLRPTSIAALPVAGGKEKFLWELEDVKDGRDEEARKAFQHAFVISDHMGTGRRDTSEFDDFSKRVIERMEDPPFHCGAECRGAKYQDVGSFSYSGQMA